MRKRIIIFLMSAMAFLSSCSFNRIFLEPTEIPHKTNMQILMAETDTVFVLYTDDNYQPTFLKNRNDTIDLEFELESVVFESSNGNSLNGWVLKPKNIIPKITLLHFHGNAGSLIHEYEAMTPLMFIAAKLTTHCRKVSTL